MQNQTYNRKIQLRRRESNPDYMRCRIEILSYGGNYYYDANFSKRKYGSIETLAQRLYFKYYKDGEHIESVTVSLLSNGASVNFSPRTDASDKEIFQNLLAAMAYRDREPEVDDREESDYEPEPVPAPSIEMDEILQEDLDVAIDMAAVEAERKAQLEAQIARFSGENCPICGAELKTIESYYKPSRKAYDVLYGCKSEYCFYQRKIYAGQI
jgi:hypothetical protein